VGGHRNGRGRRQRCRRVGAGAAAPRTMSYRARRAVRLPAGTPTRARGGVGGAGRLVGVAADRAPAVLVAGGGAPTSARGVRRACAAAAVVTPTTAVVRPSAAPAGRPGALSSRTMGRERLIEISDRMCLGCPVERHCRTSPQNTVHESDQIDVSRGLNAPPSS